MASDSKSNDREIVLRTTECPVDSVTVFNNRAEVTRVVNVELSEVGEYEVQVRGLPECVETESVRVNGTGHVVLREVSFGVHHHRVVATPRTDKDAETNPSALRQDIEKLNKKNAELATRMSEVEASKALLEKFTDAMLTRVRSDGGGSSNVSGGAGSGAGAGQGSSTSLSSTLDFSMALLEKHSTKTAEFNDKIAELKAQVEQNNKLVQVASRRLNELGHVRLSTTETSRDVTVVVEATRPGPVVLRLVYMVGNASWSPAYDVRINSNDTTVNLTYYGTIQQRTGEEWGNTKLVLSTATPSVGGVAPILPTKHVGYYAPQPVYTNAMPATRSHAHRPRMRHARRGGDRSFAMAHNRQAAMFDMESDDDEDEGDEEAGEVAAAVATSKVNTSGTAATFTIEHRKTIASDNKPHKVTVAIIDLKSAFRYYTVPALNSVAYLQCLTKNTSDYTLLGSPSVNVFLDNSFVSKTKIDNVSPGEKFRNFLGVDKAVKVTYKRVSAVHKVKGMFSKTDSTTHKFVTTVVNNKKFPIRLVLADMLPRSDDEAIKVKLVQPTPAQVEAGTKAEAAREAGSAGGAGGGAGAGAGGVPTGGMVAQNQVTHNLVWTRDVPVGAKVEVPFEYAIEFPAGRSINTYDA